MKAGQHTGTGPITPQHIVGDDALQCLEIAGRIIRFPN